MFKYNKGYTLLFAIIVSSIVLSVAVFIISSSRRQLILSSMAKDSTMAMYAADGAMQCAVMAYYDGKLATTSETGNSLSCFNTMQSNGSGFTYTKITGSAPDPSMNIKNGFVYEATVKRVMPNNTCAIITVVYGIDKTTGNTKTVIDSRGYNMANYEPCITNGKYNPRVIERGIRTQFNM